MIVARNSDTKPRKDTRPSGWIPEVRVTAIARVAMSMGSILRTQQVEEFSGTVGPTYLAAFEAACTPMKWRSWNRSSRPAQWMRTLFCEQFLDMGGAVQVIARISLLYQALPFPSHPRLHRHRRPRLAPGIRLMKIYLSLKRPREPSAGSARHGTTRFSNALGILHSLQCRLPCVQSG